MLGETQTGWAALRRHSWRKQRRITRGQEEGGVGSVLSKLGKRQMERSNWEDAQMI